MNEDQKQSWNRIVGKLTDFIRLSIPSSAQRAVSMETQQDVKKIEEFFRSVPVKPIIKDPATPIADDVK